MKNSKPIFKHIVRALREALQGIAGCLAPPQPMPAPIPVHVDE